MKKMLCVICIVLVSILMVVGCSNSNNTSTQKTEEELKAEIKVDMEKEAEMKKELEEQIVTEQKQLDENGNKHTLEGFDNETVLGVKVNYDEYIAVIVPLYDGANKDKLNPNEFEIGVEINTELTFAVFGKLEEIVISHTENGMVNPEPTIKEVGTVENSIVSIKTTLPTDFSYVGISGVVIDAEGNENIIEFGLDDMRDLSEYEPILIKTRGF